MKIIFWMAVGCSLIGFTRFALATQEMIFDLDNVATFAVQDIKGHREVILIPPLKVPHAKVTTTTRAQEDKKSNVLKSN